TNCLAVAPGGVTDGTNSNIDIPATGNNVTDGIKPTVTINQAVGQADPTNTSPVTYTIVFSEPVAALTTAMIDISTSTATVLTKNAPTGGPSTWTFTVSATSATPGDIIATIPAGGVSDLVANTNTVSTSTDNTIAFNANLPLFTSAVANSLNNIRVTFNS